MKTSADFARDIIVSKQHKDIGSGDSFVPFLIQKYISGISPEFCNLINTILNPRLSNWTDEQEIYDYLKCFIPKKDYVKFKYFKKEKETVKTKVDLESLANTLEMSIRELKDILIQFPEIEKNLIEDKEKILKAEK